MQLKQTPADFRVRELLEFTRDDQGPFFVHRLRKEKLDTLEAISVLARAGQVDRSAIAFAGLKDRQGVTEQFVSIRGRRVDYRGQGIDIRFVGRAREPLTSKMSQGNHFEIVVRELHAREAEALQNSVERLRGAGYANYFDDQRFGCLRHGQGFAMFDVLQGRYEAALQSLIAIPSPIAITGDVKLKELLQAHWGDWERCRAIARGPVFTRLFEHLQRKRNDFRGALELLPVRQKLIHAYAYQSHLWNRSLSRFLERQLPRTCQSTIHTLAGEYTGWGRLDDELRDELRGMKTPLPGPHGDGGHEAFRVEVDRVLEAAGIDYAAFERHALPGFALKEEPRPAVVIPREVKVSDVERDEENRDYHKLTLSFSLPRGAYATMWIKSLRAQQRDHRRGVRPAGRPRSYGRDDGSARPQERGGRYAEQGGDRGRATFAGGGRPQGRDDGYRPQRSRDDDYRPRRDRDQGYRPQRDEGYRDQGYRPQRDEGSRPQRDRDQGNRPQRDEGSRPQRDRDQGYRPQRDEGSRPQRDRDQGYRPQRDEGYGPRRDRDEGSRQPHGRDEGIADDRGRDQRDRSERDERRGTRATQKRDEEGRLSVRNLDERYRRAWKNLKSDESEAEGGAES